MAAFRTRSGGPTRIGSIRPSLWASIAPRSETSSQGCATATLILVAFCAAAIRRLYFSPPAGRGFVGHRQAPSFSLHQLHAEQLLDPNDPALFLLDQGSRRHQERPQGVQRRVGLRLARTDELRQRFDRALFVEQDELELLLRHLLELGKGQLSVRLSRVADDLRHAEAAFVNCALRSADIDQRAQRALIGRSRLEPMFERGASSAAALSRSRSRSIWRGAMAGSALRPTTAWMSGDP